MEVLRGHGPAAPVLEAVECHSVPFKSQTANVAKQFQTSLGHSAIRTFGLDWFCTSGLCFFVLGACFFFFGFFSPSSKQFIKKDMCVPTFFNRLPPQGGNPRKESYRPFPVAFFRRFDNHCNVLKRNQGQTDAIPFWESSLSNDTQIAVWSPFGLPVRGASS